MVSAYCGDKGWIQWSSTSISSPDQGMSCARKAEICKGPKQDKALIFWVNCFFVKTLACLRRIFASLKVFPKLCTS